jgi:hypothetical protein
MKTSTLRKRTTNPTESRSSIAASGYEQKAAIFDSAFVGRDTGGLKNGVRKVRSR